MKFSFIAYISVVCMLSIDFQGLYASPNQAIVKRVTGKSALTRTSSRKKWKTIKRGDLIITGSEIKTGKSSSVVLVWKKLEFRVGQNSKLEVKKLLESGKNRLHLAQGSSWFYLKKNSGQQLSVSTPTTIAAVRGTKFAMIQHKNESIACVCEGKISSTTNGKTSSLKTGDSLHAHKSGKSTKKDYSKLFRGLKVHKDFLKRKEAASMQYCLTCHTPTDKLTAADDFDEDDMDDY